MNGNLTITVALNDSGKAKKVTVLRKYYVTEEQALKHKVEFIRLNRDYIDTDRLFCLWQPIAKVI